MNISKKLISAALAAMLLLSLTACSVEMRDTYDLSGSTPTANDGDVPEMTPAEKFNEVGVDPSGGVLDQQTPVQPGTPSAKKEITVTITGDIKLNRAMIEDARAQAPEGKEYSFLKMYTDIYRTVSDADLAIGGYSTLVKPYGAQTDAEPPVEHIEALGTIGYDLLDISGAGADYGALGEYEIAGVSYSDEGDDPFRSFEIEGVVVTVAAIGGEGAALSYKDEGLYDELEYADLPSDVLIVLVHWDSDMESDEVESVVYSLADSGADIIVGFGDELGGSETIENESGESALVFYSLGNLVSTADEGYAICGGMLCLTLSNVESEESGHKFATTSANAEIVPTFMSYSPEMKDFGVYRIESYTDDQAHAHALPVDTAGLRDYVKSVIPADLLSEAFK